VIVVSKDAPSYAHDLARQADQDIAAAKLGLFVSTTVYPASGDLPDPAQHAHKLILLSGGTYWIAKSDGTDWFYPNNVAV